MTPFLHNLALYVLNNHQDNMKNVTLVFPTRRAGLFFNNYLAKLIEHPVWAPEVTTIDALVGRISGKKPAEYLNQLFLLWNTFRETTGSKETFDDFFFWGQIILSDFNDIDRECADAAKIYSNLSALSDIEKQFPTWDEEQINRLKQFWASIDACDNHPGVNKFMDIWEKLERVYTAFHARLRTENLVTEGLMYRIAAENAMSGEHGIAESNILYFAGFNALSQSEKNIFRALAKNGKAKFFWDSDDHYLKNKDHEAGFFLRKVMEEFPGPDFTEKTGFPVERNFDVYACPTWVGQAKLITGLLGKSNLEDTALVLADESMLLPVLYSLPDHCSEANITMGYPVKGTPSMGLVFALAEYHRRRRGTHVPLKNILQVTDLLSAHGRFDEDVNAIREALTGVMMPYVPVAMLETNELTQSIFSSGESNLGTYLDNCLSLVLERLHPADDHRSVISRQVVFDLLQEVRTLNLMLSKFPDGINDSATYLSILRQAILRLSVPFRGEPLAGLQIMGILETRLLDFSNVIVLSMNEGVLPKSSPVASLIPYNIRRAYGLLTIDHQDAVFAYHFYRLIQRAEKVSLVYSSRQKEGERGEPSRFISQIRYNPGLKVTEFKISDSTELKPENPLLLPFDSFAAETAEALLRSDRVLSPSALNSYIDCRAKYYFRYIARIRPPEEPAEGIDPATMGTVLHKVMEVLYTAYTGKMVNASDVEKLNDEGRIRQMVTDAIEEIAGKDYMPELSGEWLLVSDVLVRYTRRLLRYDIDQTPFLLRGLELKVEQTFPVTYNGETFQIKIGGYIDRLIEKEGVLVVQDFKTGNLEMSEIALDDLFIQSDKKQRGPYLQALLYSLVMSSAENKDCRPELLVVRKMYKEYDGRLKINKAELDSVKAVSNEVSEKLAETIADLLWGTEPFHLAENEKQCEYCDYRKICNR